MSANRYIDILDNNEKKGKKTIEEGRAVLDRLINMNVDNFCSLYIII